MPRQIRIQFDGAVYHVMCRGDRREQIFEDDEDRETFLRTLAECCSKTGWEVAAYVLMGNHYHFLLRTPEANLVKGMTWFQGTYTARYNARHQKAGHLFGGRYKAVLVEPGGGDYFRTVLDYIHLNPVRAGLVKIPTGKGGVGLPDLLAYPWSSLSAYAGRPSARPDWLAAADGFSACELKDSPKVRRLFIERLAQRAAADRAEEAGPVAIEGQGLQSTLRRGWCYGSSAFKETMLEAADKLIATRRAKGGAHYASGEVKRHDERAAEKVVRAALKALGLGRAQLRAMRKGAPEKGLVARKVRSETAVSPVWIAKRLEMGAPSGVPRIVAQTEERLHHDRGLRKMAKKIED